MKKIFSILENINNLFEQGEELKLKDSYEFIDFIETTPSSTAGNMKILFLSATMDVPYSGRQGIVPINNTITEWIQENERVLAMDLWEKLGDYIKENHPTWDGKLLEKYMETHDSPINQAQTEFYPEFQQDHTLRILIDVEVILER